MKKRKTIEVKELRDRVNDFCFNSEDDSAQARGVLVVLLEVFLIKTGNYRGFGFLSKERMKQSAHGTSYGIVGPNLEPEKRFIGTDHTRVEYY